MLARVQSFVLDGIDANSCEIECDIDIGAVLSKEVVVGLPDLAVKESIERVRSAVGNSGFRWPVGKMVVNLAPADVRKEGPVYDLPIALAALIADGTIAPGQGAGLDHRRYLIAGELALDGRVRPIRGALAMASLARSNGAAGVIVPARDAQEAAVVPGLEVFGVNSLAEVVGLFNGTLTLEPHPPVDVASLIAQGAAEVDFSEVRGQDAVKRAIVVAAAGAHNILMLGPAGTGKTLMAKALPGILPPMTSEEALEVTRIYSAVGKTGPAGSETQGGLITVRPVRTPHHTASAAAVIGGGAIPRPGEISLAHRGILFLDELPEFPRAVLDTLRQPLEDGHVSVSRVHSAVTFPASFMLVAAMNPTAKGDLPAGEHGRREMERYLSRVSRPLIDRIDIHVEAPAVPWKQLAGTGAPTDPGSAEMRRRVAHARAAQRRRQGETPNARLRGKQLDTLAPMSAPARELLGQAITELGLSARAYDKVRRIARTIADLEDAQGLDIPHVSEAVQYRLLDRRI